MDPRRAAVLAEAETWLNTPYHHEAQVKGAGVDCGKLLIGVFGATGLMPATDVEHYPPDFMLHRDFEWYLGIVQRFAEEIDGPPLPGDVVLFKWGRLFAHGAIVTKWPGLIHAWSAQNRVCYGDATLHPLAGREVRFFSPY